MEWFPFRLTLSYFSINAPMIHILKGRDAEAEEHFRIDQTTQRNAKH